MQQLKGTVESGKNMNWLFRRMGRKLWFAVFNLALILYLALSGRLDRSMESIVSFIITLLVINAVVLIAARNYPDWK